MSEKQNEEIKVKEVETKEDMSDEEIKENNRILRKVKKLAEKYNFKNGIDDIAEYVKKQKELEAVGGTEPVLVEETTKVVEEQPVAEKSEKLEDSEHNTYHKFVTNEKVWFIDFNSKHENKTFESIVDLYKFRPSQGTIKEVILNDIVRYRLKENHNIYEEDMICKTYDEALAKCEDMNK